MIQPSHVSTPVLTAEEIYARIVHDPTVRTLLTDLDVDDVGWKLVQDALHRIAQLVLAGQLIGPHSPAQDLEPGHELPAPERAHVDIDAYERNRLLGDDDDLPPLPASPRTAAREDVFDDRSWGPREAPPCEVPSPLPIRPRVFKRSDEQNAVVEASKTEHRLVAKAFAGSGKSTTLHGIAEVKKGKGLYAAFSKALQMDAARKFKRNVDCKTLHGLAFGFVGIKLQKAGKKIVGSVPPHLICEMLGWSGPDILRKAFFVRETVNAFTASADNKIEAHHVPQKVVKLLMKGYTRSGMSPELATQAAARQVLGVVRHAESVWKQMSDPADLQMPITHDGYLKMWVQSRPQLKYDYLLVDEGQDLSPAQAQLVLMQPMPMVMVGDSHQSIFAFRGAVDALNIGNAREMHLTQSFRFGPVIEMAPNAVLAIKGEKKILQGVAEDPGELFMSSCEFDQFAMGEAVAYVTRTNAEGLTMALTSLGKRRVAVVNGVDDMASMALSTHALWTGQKNLVRHPLLRPFKEWAELQEYASETSDPDCKKMVQLIEQYGTSLPSVIDTLRANLVPEPDADLVIGTIHSAKGREWDNVYMADDFVSLYDDKGQLTKNEEELNLLYVDASRAKRRLRVNTALEEIMSGPRLSQAPAALAGSPG